MALPVPPNTPNGSVMGSGVVLDMGSADLGSAMGGGGGGGGGGEGQRNFTAEMEMADIMMEGQFRCAS